MARAWNTLDREETSDGLLELRQRGPEDFLICIAGRVLMNSRASRSEEALAEQGCEGLGGRRAPRVLVGGLGMGITLRAALDRLPADALVVVAELQPAVLRWCRGPLAPLTDGCVDDPRVQVEIEDVARSIARASEGEVAPYDLILLDLYEGPHSGDDPRRHPQYGSEALARTRRALTAGGVLAIWGEDPEAGFEARLAKQGFAVERTRPGRGGRRHVVTLARLA